jgi:hypothetical protein
VSATPYRTPEAPATYQLSDDARAKMALDAVVSALAAPLFAVACVAALAHGLDLYRHVTDALDVPSDDDDGAAGGSA